LTSKDGSLNGSAVSDSFVRINRLVEGAAAEIIRNEQLNLGNPSRATNKDDIVDLVTGHLGILQDFLDRFKSGFKRSSINLFETSTGDIGRKIFPLDNKSGSEALGKRVLWTYLIQGVNLHSSLRNTREGPLCTLASRLQTSESTSIICDVELGFPLELILEVFKESIIEILTAEMGITGSCLDSKDTTVDIQERNIESSSSKIKDEDILFRLGLTIKAICDSSSSRLIDDTKNIKTSNGTGVLGSKTL